MSFPGRPPIIPGVPVPPNMTYVPMTAPPPPIMPSVMPIQHIMPVTVQAPPQLRNFRQSQSNQNRVNQPPKKTEGPPVTVFIGNITEKAPDAMIRQILAACGQVISWKRVQAFGFCELAGPEAGLRVVRLLHDRMVGEKRLVAKVDAKTKTVLDEYKAERQKNLKNEGGGESPLQDEQTVTDEDNYMDEESRETDKQAIERIALILEEYKDEMNNYEVHQQEEQMEKRKKY